MARFAVSVANFCFLLSDLDERHLAADLLENDVEKLHHAQAVFKRPILGGLDHRGVLINGTLEEVYAQVDKVLSEGPQNLILGANCTVPDSTDSKRLRAVVEYAHNWRKTHRE